MEGPSLHLAATQLKPFIGHRIVGVRGNSTIGIERLEGATVRDIFAWGKHLVLQFGDFAVRVHFLMFGSFEADVEGTTVTGDYKRSREPRLAIRFSTGELRLFSCSVKYVEGKNVRRTYDFKSDLMSRAWDPALALHRMKLQEKEQVADVLLDQTVFSGVGNIIKNEVLCRAGVHPQKRIEQLTVAQRKTLVDHTRAFSRQFIVWRKAFVLLKNLRIHRKRSCPNCDGPVTHRNTGKRERRSHYCPRCQPLRSARFKH